MTDTEPLEPPAPTPVEMEAATPTRLGGDGYVFGALACAIVGLVVPVLPAAAALMLLRATEPPLSDEALKPNVESMANFARGLAWFDLAWMTILCVALLLGILGRVLTT